MTHTRILLPLSRLLACLLIGILYLPICPLVAQITFTPRPKAVNLTRYDFPERCLLGINRIRNEEYIKKGTPKDTVQWNQSASIQTQPPAVVDFAKQCSARWPVSSAASHDTAYTTLMSLYLAANRDSDAEALAAQRISSKTSDDESHAMTMIMEVWPIYMQEKPIRTALIRKFIQELQVPLASFSLEQQMRWWLHIMTDYDKSVGDTILVHELGTRILSLGKTSPKTDVAPSYSYTRRATTAARDFMIRHELNDSLRHSTQAYMLLRNDSLRDHTDDNAADLYNMTGEPAKSIYGDFWFPPSSRMNDTSLHLTQKPIFPRRGKISLIAFFDHLCMAIGASRRAGAPINCDVQYAILRRLQKQYPTLELIIVSQTRGHYLSTTPAPLPPVEEANLLQKGFAAQGFDAIVSVTTTPFWHLPAPDRRRINEMTENMTSYDYGKKGINVFPCGDMFLVDDNGLLIKRVVAPEAERSEMELSNLIKALMQRTGAVLKQ